MLIRLVDVVSGRIHDPICHAYACRCVGTVKELLQAAVVVEDVLLRETQRADGQPESTEELLAALRPAAGTLRMLNVFHMPDDVRHAPFWWC